MLDLKVERYKSRPICSVGIGAIDFKCKLMYSFKQNSAACFILKNKTSQFTFTFACEFLA